MEIPAGTDVLTDLAERVQPGDLIYDEEDEEFLPASRRQVGEYVSNYPCVVRKAIRTRIQRFRKPKH
ncbi:hypothetical protein ACXWOE_10295, partial [Streptococcus pyogenes]